MKKLLSLSILLATTLCGFSQAILRNYYSTNTDPALSALGTNAVLSMLPVFDVTAFGAVGDNSTINNSNVQRTIFAVETNRGGIVRFPITRNGGTYAFNGVNNLVTNFFTEGINSLLCVRSNVPIAFVGDPGVVLRLTANPSGTVNFIGIGGTITNATDYTTNRFTHTNPIVFKDLIFDMGGHANIYDCLQIYFHGRIEFQNCVFSNILVGDAIDTQYGNDVFSDGCRFYNVGGNLFSEQGVSLNVNNWFADGCGFTIEATTLGNTPAALFDLNGGSCTIGQGTAQNFSMAIDAKNGQLRVWGCDFFPTNSATTNFVLNCGMPVFDDVLINGVGTKQIYTTTRGLKLVNSRLRQNSGTLVFAANPTNDILISGNDFGDGVSPMAGTAISISQGGGNKTTSIIGNTFRGTASAGSALDFTGYGLLVSGNAFYNMSAVVSFATNIVIGPNIWRGSATVVAGFDGGLYLSPQNYFQTLPTFAGTDTGFGTNFHSGVLVVADNAPMIGNGVGLTNIPSSSVGTNTLDQVLRQGNTTVGQSFSMRDSTSIILLYEFATNYSWFNTPEQHWKPVTNYDMVIATNVGSQFAGDGSGLLRVNIFDPTLNPQGEATQGSVAGGYVEDSWVEPFEEGVSHPSRHAAGPGGGIAIGQISGTSNVVNQATYGSFSGADIVNATNVLLDAQSSMIFTYIHDAADVLHQAYYGAMGNIWVEDGANNVIIGAVGNSLYSLYVESNTHITMSEGAIVGGYPHANTTNTHTAESYYYGQSTSTDGFASLATNAPVAINATGWTNTFTKNFLVRITATAIAITVKDPAGGTLDSYTLTGTSNEILQPGAAITAASGLAGTARPF